MDNKEGFVSNDAKILWKLFATTGHPLFYIEYCREKDNALNKLQQDFGKE